MGTTQPKQPNILFIMTDDHASHAMSCYGSRINETPNLDRIAAGGMRFDNCFCTNSICTPSRATILTGTYNHVNGVTTLATHMDNRLLTAPKLLQQRDYQTAIFGKWHLGWQEAHRPTGFDAWRILPGQGEYYNPWFVSPSGRTRVAGYATDIITDMSLDWLQQRDTNKPFFLCCHHKAPHRSWEPDYKHALMYDNVDIPEPDTLFDDFDSRASAAGLARSRMEDLNIRDLKQPIPVGLNPEQERRWRYQHYIKDYLRCIASVDDNVGRILDYLDDEGLADNTIVIYTSDQGFFLGDHGWFDKRFMYEESLRMPFVIRYPQEIAPETVNTNMILNVDFAPTFLDWADMDIPESFQGSSFRPLCRGTVPDGWQQAMYYRYWMHADGSHNICAHYGVRTLDHKLICYYGDGCGQPGARHDPRPMEWELYDLQKDSKELRNVYGDRQYADVQASLTQQLADLQARVGDEPYVPHA